MSLDNDNAEPAERADLDALSSMGKRPVDAGNRIVPMAMRELLDSLRTNWRVVQHPPLDTIDQGMELGIADLLGLSVENPLQVPAAGGRWRSANTSGVQGHSAP